MAVICFVKNWDFEFLQILIKEFYRVSSSSFQENQGICVKRVRHSWSNPSNPVSFQSPSLLPFVHQVPSGVHQVSIKCCHLSIRLFVMCSIQNLFCPSVCCSLSLVRLSASSCAASARILCTTMRRSSSFNLEARLSKRNLRSFGQG